MLGLFLLFTLKGDIGVYVGMNGENGVCELGVSILTPKRSKLALWANPYPVAVVAERPIALLRVNLKLLAKAGTGVFILRSGKMKFSRISIVFVGVDSGGIEDDFNSCVAFLFTFLRMP